MKALPVVATTGTIPINNRLVLVTEERFCMLLGAGGDPRRLQWSTVEDYTAWAIGATTAAGFLTLQTPGIVRAACKVRKQNLILTNVDAHVANYVGYPAFYGLERVATGCGAISANCLESFDDVAYWMEVFGQLPEAQELMRGKGISQSDLEHWLANEPVTDDWVPTITPRRMLSFEALKAEGVSQELAAELVFGEGQGKTVLMSMVDAARNGIK
jgi:hypothetical protein